MSDKSSEENLQDLPPKFKVIFLKNDSYRDEPFFFLNGTVHRFYIGGGRGGPRHSVQLRNTVYQRAVPLRMLLRF